MPARYIRSAISGETGNMTMSKHSTQEYEGASDMTQERDHSPIHPGEILAEDILAEFDLDAMHMAKSLGLPVHHVSQLLQGRRGIDADIAQRLARWLGTSPDMWLGLQKTYDLEVAAQTIGDDVRRTVVLREKALASQVALSADTTLP